MKILNSYCGIGGNREKWGEGHTITAIELDQKIAEEYQRRYPKDKVIIGDAHEYILRNHNNFDFVWSSPPCPTHSRVNYFLNAQGVVRYPDMKLWQEIIYLKQFHKGLFCIENVISYYEPLIKPTKIGRHYLWSNFNIPIISQPKDDIGKMCGKDQKAGKKPLAERNAVNADLGLHILNCSLGIYKQHKSFQSELFNLNKL